MAYRKDSTYTTGGWACQGYWALTFTIMELESSSDRYYRIDLELEMTSSGGLADDASWSVSYYGTEDDGTRRTRSRSGTVAAGTTSFTSSAMFATFDVGMDGGSFATGATLTVDDEELGTISETVVFDESSYLTPDSPSSVAVDRESDGEQVLTWAGNDTSPSSYNFWAGIRVRRKVDGGSYSVIGKAASNSATSYTDSTTEAGHWYQYAVCPYNSTSTTVSSYVGVYTTPLAPAAVTCATSGGTTTVTIEPGSDYVDSVAVQASTDGGATWTDVGEAEYDGSAWAIEDASAYASGVVYRAAATKSSEDSDPEDLTSDWTESDELVTECAPDAPTVESPGDLVTSGALTISWTPNHPDGSAQSAAQVEVSAPDGTTTVYDVDGSTTACSIAVDQTGSYSVRVRTLGTADEWGAWSSYISFTACEGSTITWTEPEEGGTLEWLPLTASWDVEDETGIVSQTLLLLDSDGGTVAKAYGITAEERTWGFTSEDGVYENDADYAFQLTVRNGYGLETTSEVAWHLDFIAPAEPDITVSYDLDDMSASIDVVYVSNWYVEGTTLYDPADRFDSDGDIVIASGVAYDGGVVTFANALEVVGVGVWRDNVDGDLAGEQTKLGVETSTDGAVALDRLPPLNIGYGYTVQLTSEYDTTCSVSVDAHLDSNGLECFNFGAAAASALPLGYDGSGSEDMEAAGDSYHFATTDGLPVFYPTGEQDVSRSRDYTVVGNDAYREARALMRDVDNHTCWFRDFWGARARVHAGWSLSRDARSPTLATVGVDMTEVQWEDPV